MKVQYFRKGKTHMDNDAEYTWCGIDKSKVWAVTLDKEKIDCLRCLAILKKGKK